MMANYPSHTARSLPSTNLTLSSPPLAFLEHIKTSNSEMKTPFVLTCSSDRGLCGGIHSSLAKATKKVLRATPEAKIAVLGVKARSKLNYDHSKEISVSFDGVCKFPPTWLEASTITDEVLALKKPVDGFQVVYNSFKSVIAFDTKTVKIPTLAQIQAARTF